MAKKKQDLNFNNIQTVDFDDMLQQLSEILLKPIPEGIRSKTDVESANTLLGWLANQYAYIESMHIKMASLASQLSDNRKDTEYKQYVQMRDGLERIGSALKQKYQAVSRMLTIVIGGEGDAKIGGHNSGWGSVPQRPR